MKIVEKKLSGVFEIVIFPIKDERGYFMRVYEQNYFEKYRLNKNWVQENHSHSIRRGTIRGLHFQFPPYSEAKLVRCIRGKVFDVFVDLRKDSPTFGRWDSIELSEDNKKMIYIPRGFAHGFCTLTNNCEILYKVDNFYKPEAEGGIIWNDRTLNIKWPEDNPVLSQKDANLGVFKDFVDNYGSLNV